MKLSVLISDAKQLGPIAWFVLLLMNVVIILGVVQIVSVGWSRKIHCSVDSPSVNVTKWTSKKDSISRYSMSASFRVDNQVFLLSNYDITPDSLQELLTGTGDTNKQRNVPVNVVHVLFPILDHPQNEPELSAKEEEEEEEETDIYESNYFCRSTFSGHAYQTCYTNYGKYYFSKPPDQDLSIISMVVILLLADMFFLTLYRLSKVHPPNSK